MVVLCGHSRSQVRLYHRRLRFRVVALPTNLLNDFVGHTYVYLIYRISSGGNQLEQLVFSQVDSYAHI